MYIIDSEQRETRQMLPLHLIETFIVYAETQNLVKTARVLGQTQPSASRQIEQFQSYFKKNLFSQVGKQKRLTPYGEEVRSYYAVSIRQLRDLRQGFANTTIMNQKEKLILAARTEILEKYVAPLKFKSPIELTALGGEQIRDSLNSYNLDMAVLQENFESYNYFRKKLFSTGWSLVVPKSWAAKAGSLNQWITQCADYKFASYDKSLEHLNKSRLKSFVLPALDTQFISSDWRLLAQKVRQQSYWSILPNEYIDKDAMHSLSLNQQMKDSQFYIYFKKELVKNKDVQYIVDQLS